MKCPKCGYVEAPRKPRSTGPHSQNNHAWGHAEQIALECGDDAREMLREAMVRCANYPKYTNKLGNRVPKPWREATSQEASYVIDELHRIAAFINVRLIETENY
jgi:hypothetical protein